MTVTVRLRIGVEVRVRVGVRPGCSHYELIQSLFLLSPGHRRSAVPGSAATELNIRPSTELGLNQTTSRFSRYFQS